LDVKPVFPPFQYGVQPFFPFPPSKRPLTWPWTPAFFVWETPSLLFPVARCTLPPPPPDSILSFVFLLMKSSVFLLLVIPNVAVLSPPNFFFPVFSPRLTSVLPYSLLGAFFGQSNSLAFSGLFFIVAPVFLTPAI